MRNWGAGLSDLCFEKLSRGSCWSPRFETLWCRPWNSRRLGEWGGNWTGMCVQPDSLSGFHFPKFPSRSLYTHSLCNHSSRQVTCVRNFGVIVSLPPSLSCKCPAGRTPVSGPFPAWAGPWRLWLGFGFPSRRCYRVSRICINCIQTNTLYIALMFFHGFLNKKGLYFCPTPTLKGIKSRVSNDPCS